MQKFVQVDGESESRQGGGYRVDGVLLIGDTVARVEYWGEAFQVSVGSPPYFLSGCIAMPVVYIGMLCCQP